MKKTLLFLVLLIGTIPFYAQEGAEEQAILDSLNKKLKKLDWKKTPKLQL